MCFLNDPEEHYILRILFLPIAKFVSSNFVLLVCSLPFDFSYGICQTAQSGGFTRGSLVAWNSASPVATGVKAERVCGADLSPEPSEPTVMLNKD